MSGLRVASVLPAMTAPTRPLDEHRHPDRAAHAALQRNPLCEPAVERIEVPDTNGRSGEANPSTTLGSPTHPARHLC